MKTLRTLFCLNLMLLTVGCYFGNVKPKVEWDYNVYTDFSRLKTYDWNAEPGSVEFNQLVVYRIRKAANTQLQNKGLDLSSNSPDFYIVMYGAKITQYNLTWRGYDSKLYYDQGLLKLAFYDAKSNDLLWWGQTRADLFYGLTPEKENTIVNQVVQQILSKFPPVPSD
jgi:hypothetical protein